MRQGHLDGFKRFLESIGRDVVDVIETGEDGDDLVVIVSEDTGGDLHFAWCKAQADRLPEEHGLMPTREEWEDMAVWWLTSLPPDDWRHCIIDCETVAMAVVDSRHGLIRHHLGVWSNADFRDEKE